MPTFRTVSDLYNAYTSDLLHLDHACMRHLWSTAPHAAVVEFMGLVEENVRVFGACPVYGSPLTWVCENGDARLLKAVLQGSIPGRSFLAPDPLDGLSILDRAIRGGCHHVVEAITDACVMDAYYPLVTPLIEYMWIQRSRTPRMEKHVLEMISAMHADEQHNEARCCFYIKPLGGNRIIERPSAAAIHAMHRVRCIRGKQFSAAPPVASYAESIK